MSGPEASNCLLQSTTTSSALCNKERSAPCPMVACRRRQIPHWRRCPLLTLAVVSICGWIAAFVLHSCGHHKRSPADLYGPDLFERQSNLRLQHDAQVPLSVSKAAIVAGSLSMLATAAPVRADDYFSHPTVQPMQVAGDLKASKGVPRDGLTAPDLTLPKDGDEWTYSLFIQALRSGKVAKVLLNAEGTKAEVTSTDGLHGHVTLLRESTLLQTLKKYDVEFAVTDFAPAVDLSTFVVAVLPSLIFTLYLIYAEDLIVLDELRDEGVDLDAELNDGGGKESEGQSNWLQKAKGHIESTIGHIEITVDDRKGGKKPDDAGARHENEDKGANNPLRQFLTGGSGKEDNIYNFGQSKARLVMEPDTGVTFDDVAGVDEAKAELVEVVDFLKTPQKYTEFGARIPRGILMVGPPGTGKTLLAKAVAGEAGVPFFSASGSEFVEMFVGIGAARVRDLFAQAKGHAPCLIFVDEIDAMGRARGTGIGQTNDEKEQTLNQLLIEMDGFDGNSGIILLAATNRPDILDPALLRAGRFDRQIAVDVPDVRQRRAILQVHAAKKALDATVCLDDVARQTPGFSGADLSNVLNEAAILAVRRDKECVGVAEVHDSIDRVVAGMAGAPLTSADSKRVVAYHEAGHALCSTLTPGHDPVQKVTLLPRGQAQGLTWFTPGDDGALATRQQLFARLVGALGGRAAEEVVFGRSNVTTGAQGDLQQVSSIARAMVINYGFSDIGPRCLSENHHSDDAVLRLLAKDQMSEKLAANIDRNVQRLAAEAYAEARRHLRTHRPALDAVVERLLEVETLDGDEMRAILTRYAPIPEENVKLIEASRRPLDVPGPEKPPAKKGWFSNVPWPKLQPQPPE